ncbi:hypothetical protein BOVATA_037940 [Babesia ovata]|uniref:Uncharacterized protein n=1 Tax=Babesia ovata TaxID=189622 RepID=A0A2H6KH43_9APIC|nr:uncharacterized protein BOVATA_037940 [Babesia ovata]GBE62301.1 hypothetical protein BOVATA_037940 [Babesia ovata]
MQIASFSERSLSSMNCCAPPLILKNVEAFISDLPLLKAPASAQHIGGYAIHGVLDGRAGGFAGSDQISLFYAPRCENVAISEELRGNVANGELGKYDVGSHVGHFVELVVQNGPLGVDDALELRWVLDENLGIFLLCLEFQLNADEQYFGVDKLFRLLLGAGVGEGLLEGHALDEHGVPAASSGDLLNSDHVLVKVAVQ